MRHLMGDEMISKGSDRGVLIFFPRVRPEAQYSSKDGDAEVALEDYFEEQKMTINAERLLRRESSLVGMLVGFGVPHNYRLWLDFDIERLATRIPHLKDQVADLLSGDDPDPDPDAVKAILEFFDIPPAEWFEVWIEFERYCMDWARGSA